MTNGNREPGSWSDSGADVRVVAGRRRDGRAAWKAIVVPGVLALAVLTVLATAAIFFLNQDARPQRDLVEAIAQTDVPVVPFDVVAEYPHDRSAFTEGLVSDAGVLFEGTGLYGQSWIQRARLGDGRTLTRKELPPEYFGEGITILGDRLFQLTYHAGTGFVFDKDTLREIGTFSYEGEGWGMTTDGDRLIMSNGSSMLTFLDPESLEPSSSIIVRDPLGEVDFLNELEYVDGLIYANVFRTDLVAIIDPASGRVRGWLDLSDLLADRSQLGEEDVANGIALGHRPDTLLVTGKRWPSAYEISLADIPPLSN